MAARTASRDRVFEVADFGVTAPAVALTEDGLVDSTRAARRCVARRRAIREAPAFDAREHRSSDQIK
jgi:hypothetical protein